MRNGSIFKRTISGLLSVILLFQCASAAFADEDYSQMTYSSEQQAEFSCYDTQTYLGYLAGLAEGTTVYNLQSAVEGNTNHVSGCLGL